MRAIRAMMVMCGTVILLGLGLGPFSGCGQPQPSARPLIGITSVYEPSSSGAEQIRVPFAYIRAVEANGGVPVVLPTVDGEETIDRYVAELDGLILIGGADIPPEVYGQEPTRRWRSCPISGSPSSGGSSSAGGRPESRCWGSAWACNWSTSYAGAR